MNAGVAQRSHKAPGPRGASEWKVKAACRDKDPELFYPEPGRTAVVAARRICLGCPVRGECLEYALNREDRYGVWDGLSQDERRAIITRRRGANR